MNFDVLTVSKQVEPIHRHAGSSKGSRAGHLAREEPMTWLFNELRARRDNEPADGAECSRVIITSAILNVVLYWSPQGNHLSSSLRRDPRNAASAGGKQATAMETGGIGPSACWRCSATQGPGWNRYYGKRFSARTSTPGITVMRTLAITSKA